LDKSNYLLPRAFSSSNGRVMITMHIPYEKGSIKNRFYGCSEMVLRKLFNRVSRYKNEYRIVTRRELDYERKLRSWSFNSKLDDSLYRRLYINCLIKSDNLEVNIILIFAIYWNNKATRLEETLKW